ncbi:MAG: extracellular solute-binding protein [Anaerolineaceae bacterium]|nr:extracellular solute-binding protein [Anaerolineaceae bacterium]
MQSIRTRFKDKAKAALFLGLALALLLSACSALQESGIHLPWDVKPTSADISTATIEATAVQPAADTQQTATATPPNLQPSLTIWFPTGLDPKTDSKAAKLMLEKLENFATEKGLQLQTRPKAAKGSGGLLDSLAAAYNAAPDAMPDLLILDQDDLFLAASKGYIMPLPMEGFLRDDKDWFEAARSMTNFEGKPYGAPISLDPYVLGMTGVSVVDNNGGWPAIRTSLGKVGFAADDPRGLFFMNMYMAEGGNVQDALQHPVLDVDPLSRTMIYLHQAYMDRHISMISLQAQTEAQILDALLNGNTDIGFIKLSQLLQSNQEKTNGKTLRLSLPGKTLAQGWFWAISTANPEKMKMMQALLLTLSEPSFMGTYTKGLGLLPARPSALKEWKDLTTEVPWTRIGELSMPIPSESIINRLGPILRKATLDDLRETADPGLITTRTMESIK